MTPNKRKNNFTFEHAQQTRRSRATHGRQKSYDINKWRRKKNQDCNAVCFSSYLTNVKYVIFLNAFGCFLNILAKTKYHQVNGNSVSEVK